MGRGVIGVIAGSLLAFPATATAQQDLSSGGTVTSDLWQSADHPAAALLDGDDSTHFCQHRVEDSDWRVELGTPGVPAELRLIQGWGGWSLATELRLETAYGETQTITLQTETREEQSFPLSFTHPTALVDVYVVAATAADSGEGFGGFAEMVVSGTPVDAGPATPPAISNVAVATEGDSIATVSWSTDRPATSQVRYSTAAENSVLTATDVALTTDHSVRIEATAPLRGNIELRSADAAGFRTEVRHEAFVAIDTSYQYGVGGWSFQLGDSWVRAPELYATDELEVTFTQAWIGGSGWTDWFQADDVAEMVAAGYTPEVIHYYFGDPQLDDVIARQADFLADIQTLADLLADSGVGDQVLVTLEPEFNQGAVATWPEWNDLMIQAIDILHGTAGCKVGLLPGDWDIDHVLPISMGRAALSLDYVAYQEMRASTQNERSDALQVPDRAVRFSHYLSRKFMRPVRLGYLMVSDYGGWEDTQRQVVIDMCERQAELQAAGTVAVAWMSYMDRPGAGGYFGEAEAHKGLKTADNMPKPAWHVFKECAANGPSWLDTGETPPGETGGGVARDTESCGCVTPGSTRGGMPLGWLTLGGLLIAGRRRRATR
ncbi:MAG: hypothetical protein JRI23_22325 [Deltaproteobacteria bacterium]|jgi:hypothetical protein|nr:hypothetical protein [Deltaproteobacteria bacterium]MBW2534683.1 hypothetical protein [Deltaproteobacteria bacterium]